jgi:hypothetical protein
MACTTEWTYKMLQDPTPCSVCSSQRVTVDGDGVVRCECEARRGILTMQSLVDAIREAQWPAEQAPKAETSPTPARLRGLRRLYRVTDGGEHFDVMALDEGEALRLAVQLLVAAGYGPAELDEIVSQLCTEPLDATRRVSFTFGDGERVALSVAQWHELLPRESSYAWASSLA